MVTCEESIAVADAQRVTSKSIRLAHGDAALKSQHEGFTKERSSPTYCESTRWMDGWKGE